MNNRHTVPIQVLLLFDLPEDMLKRLREMDARITINRYQAPTTNVEMMRQAEVIYGGINLDELTQTERLRWVQTAGAGIPQSILEPLKERGITLTNASGIHAAPIVEQMFGMVLMHERRLARAWEMQKEQNWSSALYRDTLGVLTGRTLGVLGVGGIGKHTARVGQAFGMRVIGLRRTGESCPYVKRMYTPENRLEFFTASDIVMNSLPLTARTREFVGSAELAAMPKGGIIVNTGRGPTIDTEALLDNLRRGHLGAAMLDVTDPEPLPKGHPLWTAPNIYITPHFSGLRPDYARYAGEVFLNNMKHYLCGEAMTNVVDLDEGY